MKLMPAVFHSLPRATKMLLSAMLAAYLLSFFAGDWLINNLALTPADITERYYLWETVTYIFLHAGFWHLAFNALMLWIFGAMMENVWGARKFAWYCLVTGMGAALCQVAAAPHSQVPVLGASGVVFGLLAAFAFEFPESTVYMYFVFPMKSKHMVLLLAVLELAASFNPQQSAIANFAHLGGMITGYFYLSWQERRAAQPYNEEPGETPPKVKKRGSDIDRILDKISRYGINSLSENEKEVMERYSKWMKK
jgi:membrane associated rhomboid family serine protease